MKVMNEGRLSARHIAAVCCVVLCLVSVVAVNTLCEAGQTGEASDYTLARIYELYTKVDKDRAVGLLDKAIYAGKYRTGAALKDTVLAMLCDYYEPRMTAQRERFDAVMGALLGYENKEVIKRYFRDNCTPLYAAVAGAARDWETPARMVVKPESAVVEAGNTFEFSVVVYNDRDAKLQDVLLRCEVEPPGKGRVDCETETMVFTAPHEEGKATLIVMTDQGNVKPQKVRIRIRPSSVSPEAVRSSPAESVEVGESSKKTVLSVSDGVSRTPSKPSKTWPVLSAAACLGCGAGWLQSYLKASDASDDCEAGKASACSDYEDLNKRENLFTGLTAATGAISAYLWWRWWRHSETSEKRIGSAGSIGSLGLHIDRDFKGVTFSYGF